MQSTRVPLFLSGIALLSACTSADVTLRKPQPPSVAGEVAAPPTPAARSFPVTGQRQPVPPAQQPEIVRARPVEPVAPQAPVPVTTCDSGGCWGNGTRFEGGAGNTYLDRNGRPCQGNGTWVQCF